eukprot:4462066-Pyramimonas_sp.AAC.1
MYPTSGGGRIVIREGRISDTRKWRKSSKRKLRSQEPHSSCRSIIIILLLLLTDIYHRALCLNVPVKF